MIGPGSNKKLKYKDTMIFEIMGNALGSDDDFFICDPTRLIAKDARDDDFSICDPTKLIARDARDHDFSICDPTRLMMMIFLLTF